MMAGIGNTLMALPLLHQLRRAFNDARIVVLARLRVTGEVVQRSGFADEVRVTGPKLASIARHTLRLRCEKLDAYIVPFPSNRWQYTLLAALSGAGVKLMHGYEVGRVRALHLLPGITRVKAERGIHDVLQNLSLLRVFGIEPDLSDPPRFPLSDSDRQGARQTLTRLGLPPATRPIIIHAGCRQTVLAAAKRWPAEKYGRLIAALEERFGRRVVLVEGPEEAGVADEIRPHCGTARLFVLPLRGPLAEAAALLEQSMLYVGSDSGLAHLAAAVGTTPVTLFAPADPDRCSPFGFRHLVIQPRGKTCAPCFDYPLDSPKPRIRCREPMCIREIAVEDVLDKVDAATRGTAILDAPRPVPLQAF
jgi:ADP-heptose:LPS heptosyltransferase